MKYRDGDLIGTASLFNNAVSNFIRLWWLRDFDYAKRNWKKLRVPTRFYVVTQGRGNGVFHACCPTKRKGKADIKFKALNSIGKVVYVGRSNVFDSLSNQMRIVDELLSLHYELTMENNEHTWFVKRVLQNRFLMDIYSYMKWKTLGELNEKRDPSCLFIIESGNFNAVLD